jgi:CubicO group peptidase (beta-lactamase class C family)
MLRYRMPVYCLVLFVFACTFNGCQAKPPQVEQPVYWPSHEWQTSPPERQGLDSALILAMLEEIQDKNLGIHSVLIVRHGTLVTEVYFPPYQIDMKHPLFSVTKSITSAMVGKAIQDGHIQGLQQNVLDFFPEIAQNAKDPKLPDINIEHLLTMSAGYLTNTMPNLYGKDAGFDTVGHILTYNSVLTAPGTTFYYDSGAPHLLSAIIEKSSGMTLEDYTQKTLFQPLGITDISWESDPGGTTTGATGLMLRPRDMAKFGYLYLHHGEWNGKQLLPKAWVETSTHKQFETRGLMNAAEDNGYGYLWWIDSHGGYSAHGFGGQYIFVLPQLDLVVVFTGGLPNSEFPLPSQLVKNYLIPAVQNPKALTPNGQAFESLQSRIQAIELGERFNTPLPEMAHLISGKTFRITENTDLGSYKAFTLTFTEEGTYQNETEWPGNQKLLVTGSLTGVFHLNQALFPGPPPQELLLPLRGYWQDEVTFIEEYMQDLNSSIDLITEKFTFDGDQVTIEYRSRMGLYSGRAIAELAIQQ